MNILESSRTDSEVMANEIAAILQNQPNDGKTTHTTYLHEAWSLITLRNEGYFNQQNPLRTPSTKATCTFLQGINTLPDAEPTVKALDVPLSPTANCGQPFGPELMFGRAMESRYLKGEDFSIVKVAAGGTHITQWEKTPDNVETFYDTMLEQVTTAMDYSNESIDA